jgi:hypothetical protein
MGFKIMRDYYAERSEGTKGRQYVESKHEYKGGKIQIKTYDDDGNLYYLAWVDSEKWAEHFHDFSTADCGTVSSKIDLRDGKGWDWFIG